MRLKGLFSQRCVDIQIGVLIAINAVFAIADIYRSETTVLVCESYAVLNPSAKSSMTALTSRTDCQRYE